MAAAAVVLALAALALVPRPASADHVVWATALTVRDVNNQTLGCQSFDTQNSNESCADSTTLSSNSFSYGGVSFTVAQIRYHPSSRFLRLAFEQTQAQVNTLQSLTLVIGDAGGEHQLNRWTPATVTSGTTHYAALTSANNAIRTAWTAEQLLGLAVIDPDAPRAETAPPRAETAPPPAAIWHASLAVQSWTHGFLGCTNTQAGKECSSTSVLSDDDFTYGGVSYRFVSIYVTPRTNGPHTLSVLLDKTFPDHLALHVGDVVHPTTHPAGTDRMKVYHFPRAPWSTGDLVALTLTPHAVASLSADTSMVDEGGSVTITVSLSNAPASRVAIPLSFANGTAEPGDYSTPRSVTINAGETSATITVTARQDADTGDETFTVSLGALPAELLAGHPSQVEITIVDDDLPFGTTTTGGGSLSVLPTDDSVTPVPPSQRTPTGTGASASQGYCYTTVGSPGNGGTEYVRYPDGRLAETTKTSTYLRSLYACN